MHRLLRRGTRPLAGALTLAVAFVSSASCFAAVAQMSDATHHACCEGSKQDCDGDTIAVQKDCCAVQSADVVRPANSAPPVFASSLFVRPSIAPALLLGAFDSGLSKFPSSPTYLLVSVFRL